jgi:nucleotide-binding universal stress UspA family protein
MYKRIMVSTDGSKLSLKAIKTATQLAKSLGAAVTGVYVMPEYVPPVYGEAAIYMPDMSPKAFKAATAKQAEAALAVVAAEAKKAGVAFTGVSVTGAQPWQAIVKTASGKKCDLVVMASHGRRGLSGLLLGSETTKVLTHSKIPVLVCR